MKLSEAVEKRLQELIDRGDQIFANVEHDGGYGEGGVKWVHSENARQWIMSALTILKSAFGEDNDNYIEVKKRIPSSTQQHIFGLCLASVKAALDDLKGGYFFDKKAL